MKRFTAAALLLALAAASARAQDLAADFAGLVAKHKLGNAAVGVCAVRVDTGEVLFASRGDETFPLASVTKTLTAAAAYEALGANHEFATRVWVLRGEGGDASLVVVGSGDPGISGRDHKGNPSAVFEQWADDLKAAGITRVTKVELDDTRFGQPWVAKTWPADQLHKWYSAPCGALALNDDCIDVTVSAGKPGEEAVVTVSPPTAYVKIVNKCVMTKVAKEHVVSIWRSAGSNTITISGKFVEGGARMTESVTIEDPGMYFGTVLLETLTRSGLTTTATKVSRLAAPYNAPFGAGQPLVHATPMREAFQVMLRRSQNFYAEQALRAAAPPGSTFETAAAACRKALAPLGVDEKALEWIDGSGLSRGNRASPATMARFLAACTKRPWFADFHGALAVPGEEGTLKERFPGLEKAVRAKTGTISGVSNLAGYVDAPGGRIAYAILCSQLKSGASGAQGIQEDFVRLLAKK